MVYLTMDLKLAEKTVFGARFYIVEPTNYVSWDLDGDWGGIALWENMQNWSRETFGPESSLWDRTEEGDFIVGRWYANSGKFWFRQEKDREWFILRWQ